MKSPRQKLAALLALLVCGIAAGGIADGCRKISVSMPPGGKPWGRTHVQARCTDGANWSLFVPVDIHVTANYLVSARPLRAGQTIAEADLATRRGDLAELPANILTDAAQAIGGRQRLVASRVETILQHCDDVLVVINN